MSIHTITAWGGIAGMVIALLFMAFHDAREVNAALNEAPDDRGDDGADWSLETHHGERSK